MSPRRAVVLRVVDPVSRTDRASASQFGNERVSKMTKGTIKKIVADRGFGFITAEDGKDYFFHRGGLQAPLDFDRLMGGEPWSSRSRRAPRARRDPVSEA